MLQLILLVAGGLTIFLVITLIRAYFHFKSEPRRPFVTCFINFLLEIPYGLGLFGKRCDFPYAVKVAIKNTGLTDFGGKDSGWIERYDVTRKVGMEKSGIEYTPLGFILIKQMVVRRVESRLQFIDYLNKHPAIDKIKMRPPVFVIGFPRTGTTFLHELLGTHPRVTSHFTWEQMEPVPRLSAPHPTISELTLERKTRHKYNEWLLNRNLGFLGDAIQSIHRIGPNETEEDTIPVSLEAPLLMSEIPLMVFACEEVLPMGCGDAFPMYVRYLKLLSYQSPERRGMNPNNKDGKEGDLAGFEDGFTWMLKCPFHLPYLSSLAASFPNSIVVWTHRDPSECIASCCSLYEALLRMTSTEASINKLKIGASVMRYTEMCLDMALQFFDSPPAAAISVVHIRYADTVKDSKGMMRNISLKNPHLGWDASCEEAVNSYLAENKRKREKMKAEKGKSGQDLHSYSLEEYGLSKARVQERFKAYIQRFNLEEKVSV